MSGVEWKRASLRSRLIGGLPAPVPRPALDRVDTLPHMIYAEQERAELLDWVGKNAQRIEQLLHSVGGVLFRGFPVGGVDGFRRICTACIERLQPYHERSTPRTQLADRIYTSTEYPADQHIAFHNEFSYALRWPMRIAFYAQQPPAVGGETPLADGRRVYDRIDPAVREKFQALGVMYVRRYGWDIDLPWEEAFNTRERREVEVHCRANRIDFQWDGDKLTTRQCRPAIARHPVTGELVWFNQAHLFHPTNLPDDVHRSMLKVMPQGLPREAFYGDGTPIEPHALSAVRAAFDATKVVIPWLQDDVMLLDNMLVNHGRTPYEGARRILVAMGNSGDGSPCVE